ncbi:SH3 domain-containing protein C23A1.17-like isoform X3 [Penaeus japonicus]|nr:SH3 domain-containing protein C23A1.17-like isoform X3 [Penaeus japonicus]
MPRKGANALAREACRRRSAGGRADGRANGRAGAHGSACVTASATPRGARASVDGMSSSRLKLRDPHELLAKPPDSNASVHAMADATTTTPTSPTTTSAAADRQSGVQSTVAQAASAHPPATELQSTQTATKAPVPPQSPQAVPKSQREAPSSTASERRDTEPVSKKRRLLEATEAADVHEAVPSTKSLSDSQDILAKACFAVGIDSDLAESVVEEPLPPPQQGSQLPPQAHTEAVHYVQELRPPYTGVPADVRLRQPEVRIHPGMHHPTSINGSYPIAEARVQYHQFPPRFHDPHFPLPRRVPVHADPRHCHPGPPHPRYQYVAYPRSVPGPVPRAILVSERVPPSHHPAMHHDPRHPHPSAMQHDPRLPQPAVIHHDLRHPSSPALQHDPRLPPPEYRHAQRVVPEVRHIAPGQPEVRYRMPINHHEVAIVAPVGPTSFVPADNSRPGPPQSKLERQPHTEQRPRPYEMYTSPPGSAHSPKDGPYAPVSPHAFPGNHHYGPPRVVDRYNKHPYGRAEINRDSGLWHDQATPPPNAPPQHSPEGRARPLEPVRSPYASPQENAWAAKRYPESQDKEFIPPQRLREPKPCVELIPLRHSVNQEKDKKNGGEVIPVPSSPGPPQKHQAAAATISPATVTPVNRKTSEQEAPAEKYARINASDNNEIPETSRSNVEYQRRPSLSVTEAGASSPTNQDSAVKRDNFKDAFVYPEKSDESVKRLACDLDKAEPTQTGVELRKKSEDSTEMNSKQPGFQEHCMQSTPKSAAVMEISTTKTEPFDSFGTSKRHQENGDPISSKKEGQSEGSTSDPHVLGQFYNRHSSGYVSQGRSASEPPPGAVGPSTTLISSMRPASLPAPTPATQMSVSNHPLNRDSTNPDNMKVNGKPNTVTKDNQDNDEVFIERLRFVLDDLVSVPEATLPKASHSPQQVLAYLVRQGGGQPSAHPCLRERLREDFLTMVKRYMPGSTLADWGWDSCTPEQILDQLIKVSTGSDEGINGSERSPSTASVIQDDALDDDVFTPTSDTHHGPKTLPAVHSHPPSSLPIPTSLTSVPHSTSPPTSTPCTVAAETRKPQEEIPQNTGQCSPVSQSSVPQTPPPITSPLGAPTSHAYNASSGLPHTSTTQTSPQHPTTHAVFSHAITADTKTQHVSTPRTITQHTYPVYTTAAQVPTNSPANPYTLNADTTVRRASTTLTNIAHVNSSEARVINVSSTYTTAPPANSNAPSAHYTQANVAQALTTYTTIPHTLPSSTQVLHSSAIHAPVQHTHHQGGAPATPSPGHPDAKFRQPASRTALPEPVSSVPHSAPSVPHTISPVPHSITSVPHSASSAPHSVHSVPHSTPPVPHSVSAVPHSVPHSTPSVPHSVSSVSHSASSAPHSVPSVPHSVYSVPHSASSVPHPVSSVPHSIPSVPHSAPSISHHIPSVPSASHSVPSVSLSVPPAHRSNPSVSHSAPQVPHSVSSAHHPPVPHSVSSAHRPPDPHSVSSAHHPSVPHSVSSAHRPPDPHSVSSAHHPSAPHSVASAHRPPGPHSAPSSDPHFASRERIPSHGGHASMALLSSRSAPYPPGAAHPPPIRHSGHPHLAAVPPYQTYNHHAPVHPTAGSRVSHPGAHSTGVHPPPVLIPAAQNAHYPRQPHHLAYHQAQHHIPSHYQYSQHQYAQQQMHSTKKWTGASVDSVVRSAVYAALNAHAPPT